MKIEIEKIQQQIDYFRGNTYTSPYHISLIYPTEKDWNVVADLFEFLLNKYKTAAENEKTNREEVLQLEEYIDELEEKVDNLEEENRKTNKLVEEIEELNSKNIEILKEMDS